LKYSQPHFENWRLIEVQEQFWNRASVLLCLPELQIHNDGDPKPHANLSFMFHRTPEFKINITLD
jgi:hypothetical protein